MIDLVIAVMVGATLGGYAVACLSIWERRSKLLRKRLGRMLHRVRDRSRTRAGFQVVAGRSYWVHHVGMN